MDSGLRLTWACEQVREVPGAPVIGGDRGTDLKRRHWDERELVVAPAQSAFEFRMAWHEASDLEGRLWPEERAWEEMAKHGILKGNRP